MALAGEGSRARRTGGAGSLEARLARVKPTWSMPADWKVPAVRRRSDAWHFTWKSLFGPLFLVLPRKKILIVNTLVCVCVCVALNDDVQVLMGYKSPWKNKRKRAFDTHLLPPDVLHAFSM